jgi:uncharacterized protein involved in type VI secretion and phage assembly
MTDAERELARVDAEIDEARCRQGEARAEILEWTLTKFAGTYDRERLARAMASDEASASRLDALEATRRRAEGTVMRERAEETERNRASSELEARRRRAEDLARFEAFLIALDETRRWLEANGHAQSGAAATHDHQGKGLRDLARRYGYEFGATMTTSARPWRPRPSAPIPTVQAVPVETTVEAAEEPSTPTADAPIPSGPFPTKAAIQAMHAAREQRARQ